MERLIWRCSCNR